jgi:catechol 2,3-dioxygenase-like lactoylglutathione lyase family enzyme
MIKTHGVLHFTIPVKDLDRAAAFYKDIFGFEHIRRNKHMLFMQSGQDSFVLTHSEKPVDPNPEDGTAIHSAFRVTPEEYDRAMKFLKEKGIKILKEEDRDTGTFQGRSAYFEDPDRNVLEIMDLRRGPVPEGQ